VRHDDIGVGKLPQLAADFYAVQDGKHDIEDNEIRLSSACEFKGCAPIRRCQHLVLFAFEIAAHQFHQRRFIVYY